MPRQWLRIVGPDDLPDRHRDPVPPAALAAAREIVDQVRERGEAAVREQAERFGELTNGEPLVIEPSELEQARDRIDSDVRDLLERTARQIERFAVAQRRSLLDAEVTLPGGAAGHTIAAVERAGCYAPGGRYPLPSSVLMTAVTARVAGVEEVWVASPRPTDVTLAAAAIAGADGLLRVGGAQAIAALAFGVGGPPACDVIVGPGNSYVTAAKQIVSRWVGIDMLAGPSELVVLADSSADPELVAADLLAQAEHDPEALPVLVATDADLIARVDAEIDRQLADLSTREIAQQALANGFAVCAADIDEAAFVCDRLSPEHLALHVDDAATVAGRCRNYGGIFVGSAAAEVLGDYGAGPNHTLPTGGTARHRGGLSVFDFLAVRTWLRFDDPVAARTLAADAASLAQLEGLEAHRRSALRRHE